MAWLVWVHSSEECDKVLWSRYRKVVRDLLVSSAPAGVLPEEKVHTARGRAVGFTWLVLEVLITVVMATILFAVLIS